MKTFIVCALAPIAAALAATPAVAQNYAGFHSQCQCNDCGAQSKWTHDSFHYNMIWPRPYMAPSRRGICQAFDVMVANGWRHNNLLTQFDFDPKTGGLSEAGRLHVTWILTQAPQQRRTVFVQRAADAAKTAERVEAVQLLAADLSLGGPADVQETIQQDYGRPAQSVDAVFTGFGANQPLPVLPQASAESSGEGS